MIIKGKAYYILISFLFFSLNAISQDQKLADSLAIIYAKGGYDDKVKLELLRQLAFNQNTDLELGLKYAEELITLSEKLGNDLYLHRGYLQKGNKKRLLGDFEEALNAFFNSAEIADRANYAKGEASAYISIADVYSYSNNHENALSYYRKAIAALRKSDDPVALGSALLNAGDEFQKNKNYDSALIYLSEAGVAFEKSGYETGKAYTWGNLGMVYAGKGNNDLAENYFNRAISMLEKFEDYSPICTYQISLSSIYFEKGDTEKGIAYAQKSLGLAQQYGFKVQVMDANLKLSELYEKTGNVDLSFKHFKNYITFLRDSVSNIQAVQKMSDLRYNHEISKKQVEVDLLNEQKKNQQTIVIATIIALVLILLLLFGLYQRYKFTSKTNKIIEAEKKRSESLLLNILPEETAMELKQSGKVRAKKFNSVTVMFTDFQGFTQYATYLEPEILVETVDFYFSKFDQIIEKFGLEKIKTVGDSYMCAGGLPFPSGDHAFKMVQAALEIERFIYETKNDPTNDKIRLDIRIGINTGPVVAGVVGTKKFAYDIWGDTVNIASRMESNSLPGRINISENTYELVKHAFDVEYRGELHVKNRGVMKMYFVNQPA